MAIITTFENQCRALASAASPDENASRFLVGTLTPKQENLIYLFEYKDDNNNLAKIAFKFPYGEIWHLNTFTKYPKFVTGVTSNKEQLGISLFKLPNELDNPIEDDYGFSESPIEKVFEMVQGDTKSLTRQCHWHPDDGDRLLTCSSGNLEFWDINDQQLALKFSLEKVLERSFQDTTTTIKSSPVADLRWSSLFNCSVVACAIGSKIYGIDTRIPDSSSTSVCWLIEDVRCNRIKSIDFNPNSQYYLASGGDDCRANFWDLRQTSSPVLHLQTHSHWIWSLRYNPFHDQLVLSAGSDARVALMRVQSIASEPYGQMTDYDDGDEVLSTNTDAGEGVHRDDESRDVPKTCDIQSSTGEIKTEEPVQNKDSREDKVINVYEEHDDSVYASEWATNPWIFASLGFESRLVINKVPKAEKFNILF